LSVYPAGVKQFFKDEVTVADGVTTLINHPCVVKSISASPCSDFVIAFAVGTSLVLNVYDGSEIVLIMAGSAVANYLVSDTSILLPADGLRIGEYLAVECKEYADAGGSDTQNKHVNIRVDYQ
jgi:hypothetical protein